MEINIGKVNDVEEGKGKVVEVNGKTLALFKKDGKFYAIENTCLHRGGPLGEGELNDKVVTCPWHGWQFDITTGKSAMMPEMGVKSYKVEVKGNDVVLHLEE